MNLQELQAVQDVGNDNTTFIPSAQPQNGESKIKRKRKGNHRRLESIEDFMQNMLFGEEQKSTPCTHKGQGRNEYNRTVLENETIQPKEVESSNPYETKGLNILKPTKRKYFSGRHYENFEMNKKWTLEYGEMKASPTSSAKVAFFENVQILEYQLPHLKDSSECLVKGDGAQFPFMRINKNEIIHEYEEILKTAGRSTTPNNM